MTVLDRSSDPIMLQLLKLSVRKRNAIVAACDADLRYTHLFNPHPAFSAEDALGKRDDELAPVEHVADLMAMKRQVLETGRELWRRVEIQVVDEARAYDVLAEPIHGAGGELTGVATAAVDVTPTVEAQTVLRRVSEVLERRSDALAAEWHETLGHRLSVRPEDVFPTDDLLDGAPGIVAWLARSVLTGDELSEESADSLRDIAEHWRRSGYSIEESLLHVRLLSGPLMDALGEAADEEEGRAPPSAGVEAARRLSSGLDAVKRVFVAAYRDREETRFTEFGATMAHEIRSHLGAAITAVDLLDLMDQGTDAGAGVEAGVEEKREKVQARLRHALEQANQVVMSVHALSQTSAGRGAAWGYRPLDEMVAEAVANRVDDGRVHVEADPDIPHVRVPAEPVQLILHNLIENAVKYTNPDASEPWVKVHTEKDARDGHLVVHVGDNGLGIPEAEQERIFLRFRRGREARGDGFGLGLAIVREAAGQFGGRVLLESEPGKGSTFSFTIPAEQLRD